MTKSLVEGGISFKSYTSSWFYAPKDGYACAYGGYAANTMGKIRLKYSGGSSILTVATVTGNENACVFVRKGTGIMADIGTLDSNSSFYFYGLI